MGNNVHFFRQSSGGGGDAFIATFRTTSANESITLPYLSTGTYSGTIDWGDGTVVANSFANSSHTYANSGDYDVTILGEMSYFRFRFVSSSANKIIEVKQWGTFFVLTDSSFYNCSNLILSNVLDTPIVSNLLTNSFRGYTGVLINNINNWDVSNTTTFTSMFDSSNFNDNISNWDVSNATTFKQMFYKSTFNQDISSWDTSSLTSLQNCFYRAGFFNQDISSWNTSSVKFMNTCFRQAISFNQDISAWDFSGLNSSISLSQFMFSKTSTDYDAIYYDNLLIKWASDPSVGGLQSNVIGTIDMGSIKYTSAGASARASILANNKAVTINDGGQI